MSCAHYLRLGKTDVFQFIEDYYASSPQRDP